VPLYEQDVRAILSSHQSGKLIIAEYETTGILVRRKHELIHLVVAHMIDKTGHM